MTEAEQQDLVMFLERDQLLIDTTRPVARRALSPRVAMGLGALRVFVIVVSLMVIYTFASQLVH